MAGAKFIEVVLTCGSWQEAQGIVDALLEKHLIACAEFLEVKSKNLWQGKIEEGSEIKLIMQTRADYFAKIETIVKKLHSYETPAMHALPISHITMDAQKWLETETNG